MGEGISSVPAKLAERIWRGEYVEMGELLPEFWSGQKDEVLREARPRDPESGRHFHVASEFRVLCGGTGSSGTRAGTGADDIPVHHCPG